MSATRIVLLLPDNTEHELRNDRPPQWKRDSVDGQIRAITEGGNHHRYVVLELANGTVIELPVDLARQVRIEGRPPA